MISQERASEERAEPRHASNGANWRRLEACAVFLASFLVAAFVIKEKAGVEGLLTRIGLPAYPLAVAIFAVVASAPFSVTDALAIMNGVIFGPWRGSLVNAAGLVFAAIAGYAIARRTSHLLQLESSIERLPAWIRRFRVGSPQFLLALRFLPGVGGTLATQVAAALRVPLFVQVWTMCTVAVPVCTLLAIFGDRVALTVHAYYQAHAPHVHIHLPHVHLRVPVHLHVPARVLRGLDIFHHHRHRRYRSSATTPP